MGQRERPGRGRRPARVAIIARDPRLRALLEERLRAGGGILVQRTVARSDAAVQAFGEDGDWPITPREAEVLGLLADGLANKQIAARLGISPHTAKYHVQSIMRRLSAANRAEAVREGIRRGLIGI